MSTTIPADERFTMICVRCERSVYARDEWVGSEVQCPHCSSVIRVPERGPAGIPVRAEAPTLSKKRVFNFPCPRCETLLEGHSGMSGHKASCPTCAARLVIPFLRRSGQPDPATLIDDDGRDFAAVHAYAADGSAAPQIVELENGALAIRCPRCEQLCAIDADVCRHCSAPFTMEAAPTTGKIRRDTQALAALTFGIVSLAAFPFFVPAMVAIWMGLRSFMNPEAGRRPIAALIGVILGVGSLVGGTTFLWWRLAP